MAGQVVGIPRSNTHTEDTMATVQLRPIAPLFIELWIKGISPLIQHAWSEKGLAQMRKTAAERKKTPKVPRDPESEFKNATHRTDEGGYGIPILAFKAALISAAHKDYGLEKTTVRKALFVPCSDSGMIVPMECAEPIMREDIVRIGMNQTDLRYRPEFTTWRVHIRAQVDKELLSTGDVVNLVGRAGFSIGIGEWRPEKGGENGRFELDLTEPIKEG